MNTLNDIFIAEIKNLYALEKQTAEVIESLNSNVAHKKLDKRVRKIHKNAKKNLKTVHAHLKEKDINPGNVVDSIIQEMSDNLQNVKQKELSPALKDVSLWTSLNRLLSYKVACYENATELAQKLDDKTMTKSLQKCLKRTKKGLDKLHGKAKKKILKHAVN